LKPLFQFIAEEFLAMRVSTTSIYGNAASSIANRQAELAKTGEQMSSGLRITTSADDPIGAARLVELDSAKARNDQLSSGETAARNALSQAESVLALTGDTYSDIRVLLIQAGNDALSDNDRKSIAAELSARRDTLLGLANSRDAEGRYLFAGHRESQTPFVNGAAGIEYQGDDGRRDVQVGLSRMMTVTTNGADLFARVRSGNGVFDATAAFGNGGTGTISVGTVANASALDGRRYQLVFHVDAGNTTYDVLDGDGNVVSAAQSYKPGGDITLAGMQVKVNGAPAEGDVFDLAPAAIRTVFQGLDETIALLRAPVSSDVARQQLKAGLASGLSQIEQASERALLSRADAGSALKELDTLNVANSARDEQLQKQISDLRDLDYVSASIELAQRQMVLQAAQQTYARILGKSIFDFL
jgi:flagellar hook-associated protein 3 FlgL